MEETETIDNLVDKAEVIRGSRSNQNNSVQKKQYSQFFTPSEIASFMASLFTFPNDKENIKILDPGAGTGILSTALMGRLLNSNLKLKNIEVTAIEIDANLNKDIENSLEICNEKCREAGIKFSYKILNEDFIKYGCSEILNTPRDDLFFEAKKERELFDLIILNPPYKKIESASDTRDMLNKAGLETTNLYTAFLYIASYFLEEDGQIAAITPRSFCNGTYFKKFREVFFSKFSFHRIHLYNHRNRAFKRDDVLQENIIFLVSSLKPLNNKVHITTSDSPEDETFKTLEISHDFIIQPDDKDKIIHIITDEYSLKIIDRISSLKQKLNDIGVNVSTGKIVDFRIKTHLAENDNYDSAPLYYPFHFSNGKIVWPTNSAKKKEAVYINSRTEGDLISSGYYVFCKRFSSKEEKKRITAAFYDYTKYNFKSIGIENHLNYFHIKNNSLPKNLALGLTIYLNSTLVDQYFRLFNGHTQVNAEDLRFLYYPNQEQLNSIGKYFIDELPNQEEIDMIIEKELFNMAKNPNPTLINTKINEALSILKQIGLPRNQQNERSALTLLAMVNLKPSQKWREGKAPLIGITSIMNFMEVQYGKKYAPNTRESIRRQTVHQFVQAGLIVPNPDIYRPTNSPNFVYQIEQNTLNLVQGFKSNSWDELLKKFLSNGKTLSARYAQEREMEKIPLRVADKVEINISKGGQNVLVEKIVNVFCPLHTPGSKLIYIGDAKIKWAYFNGLELKKLGVVIKDEHGKMPDVIVYFTKKKWLILIEAVTSHGPINPKRKIELEELFSKSKAGLVFITAFLTKKTLLKYMQEIAWETDIWVADDPTHLIHLNGERFLGPYNR
ncbi:MAG: BsuBI/PstI family type II restriction endonuclease [Ignavibacteriaceae bacterium]|jgi:adenine-specific DNA-methyltransferase